MTDASEFSRPFAVDRLVADGQALSLRASPAEREALAGRLEVEGVSMLEADIRIFRDNAADLVEVRADVRATVDQLCVVTVDLLTSHLSFGFERRFTTAIEQDAVEVIVDPQVETPEPLTTGILDFGEMVVEELAVHLDPYPRAPDADEQFEAMIAELKREQGPFAALASLSAKAHEGDDRDAG